MDWQTTKMWVSENVFSSDVISGGFQVNISYFGVAIVLAVMFWRITATRKKVKKAYKKGLTAN